MYTTQSGQDARRPSRTRRRAGRAGFGDDARLAHFFREQALADGVVDFVRAGVEQIFALEADAGAAQFFGKARGKLQRRGTAGEISE